MKLIVRCIMVYLGKSTLLDVLAGRLDSIQCKGTVCVNGNPIDLKSYRKETAYVMQSDALFPLLTGSFMICSLL